MSVEEAHKAMTQRYTKSQMRNAPVFLVAGGALIGCGATLAGFQILEFTDLVSLGGPFAILALGSMVLVNAFQALKLSANSDG